MPLEPAAVLCGGSPVLAPQRSCSCRRACRCFGKAKGILHELEKLGAGALDAAGSAKLRACLQLVDE